MYFVPRCCNEAGCDAEGSDRMPGLSCKENIGINRNHDANADA